MTFTLWKLEAAFDATLCKATLFDDGGGATSYRCSQSIFLMDILFNPDPSVIPLVRFLHVLMKRDPPTFEHHCHVVSKVPIRQASVNDIGDRYYKEPSPYHGTLKVCVPPDWMQHNCCKSRAKPISPPENILAFLL